MRGTSTRSDLLSESMQVLLAQVCEARVAVVAAPLGYGKSKLTKAYIEGAEQQTLYLRASVEDARNFAERLTRLFDATFSSQIFSGIYSDFANIMRHETPEGLAQVLAHDLRNFTDPVRFVFSDIHTPEIAVFVAELAWHTPKRFSYLLSGYPLLAVQVREPDIVVESSDLEYTPRDLEAMGVSSEVASELRHWPTAIDTYRFGGQQGVGQLVRQLVRRMEQEQPELLRSALLPAWFEPTGAEHLVELQALELSPDYLKRLQSFGWPLTQIEHESFPYPLFREAMLTELELSGERAVFEARLADVIEATQPVRAIELRSKLGDEQGVLRVTRESQQRWTAQGQWTQLIAGFKPFYRLLTPAEKAVLARALLETAVTSDDLRTANHIATDALQSGGPRTDLGVIQAEIYLRLGRIGAARTALTALIQQESDPELVAWYALTAVQVDEAGAALRLLRDEPHARSTILGQVVYALALTMTQEAEKGARVAQQLHNYFYLEGTATALLKNIRGVFALIQLLSDTGAQAQAEELLSLLPLAQGGYWFEANVLHMKGLFAWRSWDEAEARYLLSEAASKAEEAQDNELLGRILQTTFLMLVYFARYKEAAQVRRRLRGLLSSERYMELWARDTGVLLEMVDNPALRTSRPTSFQEVGLVLRVLTGGSLDGFALGLRRFWEHWIPLPEMGAVTVQELSESSEQGGVQAVTFLTPVTVPQQRLYLQLMGGLQVTVDGSVVRLPAGMATLLCALALGPQEAGVLARVLFAEHQQPVAALRTAVSRLKSKVGPYAPGLMARGQSGIYRLDDTWRVSVDVHEVLQASAEEMVQRYAPLSAPAVVLNQRPDAVPLGLGNSSSGIEVYSALRVLTPEQFDAEVWRCAESYPDVFRAGQLTSLLVSQWPARFGP